MLATLLNRLQPLSVARVIGERMGAPARPTEPMTAETTAMGSAPPVPHRLHGGRRFERDRGPDINDAIPLVRHCGRHSGEIGEGIGWITSESAGFTRM